MSENPYIQIQDPIIEVENFDFYYGDAKALFEINIGFPRRQVTALIGPSGCGKSTLLRCFNRMNDLIDIAVPKGNILMNGADIYASSMDVIELRRRVGMVFHKSNPFPKSIYENVVYGLRIAGVKNKTILEESDAMARRVWWIDGYIPLNAWDFGQGAGDGTS